MRGILIQPDGKVLLVALANETPENLEALRMKCFPTCVSKGLLDPSELPDGRFIDCWRWVNGALAVDLALARQQRLAEIRAVRDNRFTALDGPWMRAMGQKRTAEADAIEAKRQILRTIPQMLLGTVPLDGKTLTMTLADCKTPEALAALEPIWPE